MNVAFGWMCEEDLYEARKRQPHSALRITKSAVYRDSRISDLSMPIAMSTCLESVVEGLKQFAQSDLQGQAQDSTLETATYLGKMHGAYHVCLLNTSTRLDSAAKLTPVTDLYIYYKSWLTALDQDGCNVLSSKIFKGSIAYQT